MTHQTSYVELSVVVIAKGMGRTLRPTIRSVLLAAESLPDINAVEIVLVHDAADSLSNSEALHWVKSTPSISIRIVSGRYDSDGQARNAGFSSARGLFAAMVDGGHVISPNWLAAATTAAQRDTTKIVHPAIAVSFGDANYVRTSHSSSADVSIENLLDYSPWPSTALALRDTFLSTPYRSLPHSAGFGPDDWMWNIDTIIVGAQHVSVPETVVFERIRRTNGMDHPHDRSVLPFFDVAGLRRALSGDRSAQISNSATSAAPATPDAVRVPLIKRVVRRLIRLLPATTQARISVTPQYAPEVIPLRATPAIAETLKAVTKLDPAISWIATHFEEVPEWKHTEDNLGQIVNQALLILGNGADAIVAVPWLGVGGGDLVARNYAKALQEGDLYRNRVTILATADFEKTLPSMIPDSVPLVHMPETFRVTPPQWRQRIMTQLLVLASPEIVISVNCFHVSDALHAFPSQITARTRVYLALFAFWEVGDGYPSHSVAEEGLRVGLDSTAGIITDNSVTARLVTDIMAIEPARLFVHHQPAIDKTPDLDRSGHAFTDEDFSVEHPFRLVWPHRLDIEKRPRTLVLIAREAMLRGLPVVFDVWGQEVVASSRSTLMDDLSEAGVRYRGPYTGGLAVLPTNEYHALLLTSETEGLPLVLVQSLLLGLPVIASNVGGVSDLVSDNLTGLLVAGPDDIAGFVDAIEKLLQSRPVRRRLIEQGYQRACERHSWERFRQSVEDISG